MLVLVLVFRGRLHPAVRVGPQLRFQYPPVQLQAVLVGQEADGALRVWMEALRQTFLVPLTG